MRFINKSNSLVLWISDFKECNYILSTQEKKWAESLSILRSLEYRKSRGLLRKTLSNFFDISPSALPLYSPPGVRPILGEGYGHVSLSHTSNQILIGWSKSNIGVDIEYSKRTFNAKKLYMRFFSEQEILQLSRLNIYDLDKEVLKLWVIKEASIKLFNTKLIYGMKNFIYSKSKVINIDNNQEENLFFAEYKNFSFAIANSYSHNIDNLF